MANTSSKILLLATLLTLMNIISTAKIPPIPKEGLASRLKLEGETTDCWESLVELQACTGEVIMFFLNGETYLGPTCCQAIRIIGQHCWPAMFGAIGFTDQEADVLQGFCDTFDSPSVPPSQLVPVKN